MPQVKKIEVQEDVAELKKLYQKAAHHLKPRVKMLLLCAEKGPYSNVRLAEALKVSRGSVQTWKTLYVQGGLVALLRDERGGNRPSKIDKITAEALAQKLSDAHNAPRSFTELQSWVEEHYLPGINYHTLNKYVKRKHGASIKVVRKTHAQKDAVAVEAFKKK